MPLFLNVDIKTMLAYACKGLRSIASRPSVASLLASMALAACVQPPSPPTNSSPPPPTGATKPMIGVAAHLWGLNGKDADQQIDLAAAANFKIIRWDMPWAAVEVEQGQLQVPQNWDYIVDQMRSKGMQSIVVLDYGNKFHDHGDKPVTPDAIEAFAKYSAFVAKHFAGRVKYYEVWNEWNSRIGKTNRGSSADYAALLRSTYTMVKTADPSAQVIAGGLSSSSNDSIVGYGEKEATLEQLLDQGIGRYCDAFSIHPYVVYRDGPTRSFAGFQDLMTKVIQRIRRTPDMAGKPIFVSEIGWPTAKDSPRGVSEAQQAEYVAGAIDLSGKLGIAAVIVYELRDSNRDPNDPEGNFGITRNNFSEKPLYRHFMSRQPAQ